MINYRIVERPAFNVLGRKTWISGQDNALFGRFWETCRQDGLFALFEQVNQLQPGQQTGGTTLGISRVENDPEVRCFDYMIAVETSPESSAWVPTTNSALPSAIF
jgi:AraC family transcriptional regulator